MPIPARAAYSSALRPSSMACGRYLAARAFTALEIAPLRMPGGRIDRGFFPMGEVVASGGNCPVGRGVHVVRKCANALQAGKVVEKRSKWQKAFIHGVAKLLQ